MSRQLGVLIAGALLCSQMAHALCSLDGTAENALPKQEQVALSAQVVEEPTDTQEVAKGVLPATLPAQTADQAPKTIN